MKLFNSLTRQKEEFVPLEPGKVKMYSCGPTVYNYFHIGNARPFIMFDTLRRYFEYRGYEVNFVQNFTDIDDKMIKRANEEGITVRELADRFIAEYFVDSHGLGIHEATTHPRATENIDEIIALVQTLIDKGHAYQSGNDVYYSTKSFPEYGKLSHQPLEELEAGARIDVTEVKRDPMDFALWKGAKPGEPSWDSPWGKGRPGWHIECSAMAGKYLGKTIDIHSGGLDLTFPHHENEIAQSEGANGCTFANYWLHNGFINVDNQKMSKSLGNFFTVRDVAQIYPYEVIRFFMLSSHYRSPINYSADILEQARAGLERIQTCMGNVDFMLQSAPESDAPVEQDRFLAYKDKFIAAMDDDMNTADAISAIFELVREINTLATPENAPSKAQLTFCKELLAELCGVLGIACEKKQELLDSDIDALIQERQEARKARNFQRADEIRDQLKEMGILLEDTKAGVKWKRA
ncbi:MAG: cysteine--tRNA ligase [Eubacteriales bacterium]|jgi:cysteinyl-tRNA synthetase